MKKIKFRAMWGGDWFYFTLDDITGCDMSGVGKPMLLIHLAESKWVTQSTGLFDKNGVEIYEGDIVYYHCDVKHKGTVDFKHGGFGVYFADIAQYDHFNMAYIHDYEVIGNIYENPELLS